MVVPAFYILGVFPKDYNTCNSTEWPLLFSVSTPPLLYLLRKLFWRSILVSSHYYVWPALSAMIARYRGENVVNIATCCSSLRYFFTTESVASGFASSSSHSNVTLLRRPKCSYVDNFGGFRWKQTFQSLLQKKGKSSSPITSLCSVYNFVKAFVELTCLFIKRTTPDLVGLKVQFLMTTGHLIALREKGIEPQRY